MTKRRSIERALKRALDVAGAAAGLTLLGPLLVAIALAVKWTSRGPVFYRGVRAGRHGRPFRIYKFRTMIPTADQTGSPTTAEDDPRITPLGHVLRSYKLDELPQLFNVLRGEMSFVGPRPEVLAYATRYDDQQRIILSVRPGITDLASLRFHDLQAVVGRDDPEAVYRDCVFPEKIRLQMDYVRQWSLWTDLVILCRTLALLLAKPLRRHT